MTSPHFGDSRVAQAVYTWSKTSIDGSKGMGFTAVSPLLEGCIDWLTKLQLPEFQLLPSGIDESLEHYESRVGFSEVGRTCKEGVGIIYCKTADGAVDSFSRPQPVVHAFFGSSEALGLLCVTGIPKDRWIREVRGSAGGGLRLPDVDVSHVCTDSMAVMQHNCPEDHDGARQMLRMVAEYRIERIGTIDIAFGCRPLVQVSLAFPIDIADSFCLTPYVTVDGTRRELEVRVPDARMFSDDRSSLRVTSGFDSCQFQQSITAAAEKFLYVAQPSLRRYAEAALRVTDARRGPGADGSSTVASAVLKAQPGVGEATAEPDLLSRAINAARRDSEEGPLSQRESFVLADNLREAGFNLPDLLTAPPSLLLTIFTNVSAREAVLRWSRQLGDAPLAQFVELWNRTGVAFFLGVVLLRNLDENEGSWHVAATKGLAPGSTVSVLRSVTHYPDGGLGLARVISRGFGDNEMMRRFISIVFADNPRFLYDAVLARADLSDTQMLDYIRFGFESWTDYRRIPADEASAIYQVLRPKLFHKLRVLLGK